jgi:hypothetical protein
MVLYGLEGVWIVGPLEIVLIVICLVSPATPQSIMLHDRKLQELHIAVLPCNHSGV